MKIYESMNRRFSYTSLILIVFICVRFNVERHCEQFIFLFGRVDHRVSVFRVTVG